MYDEDYLEEIYDEDEEQRLADDYENQEEARDEMEFDFQDDDDDDFQIDDPFAEIEREREDAGWVDISDKINDQTLGFDKFPDNVEPEEAGFFESIGKGVLSGIYNTKATIGRGLQQVGDWADDEELQLEQEPMFSRRPTLADYGNKAGSVFRSVLAPYADDISATGLGMEEVGAKSAQDLNKSLELEDDSWGKQFAFDTGAAIPDLAIGAGASTVNPMLAATYFGSKAFIDKKDELQDFGVNNYKASALAGGYAATSGLLEQLPFAKLAKPGGKLLWRAGKGALYEGTTEALQGAADSATNLAAGKKDTLDEFINKTLYSGAIGVVTGGGLGATFPANTEVEDDLPPSSESGFSDEKNLVAPPAQNAPIDAADNVPQSPSPGGFALPDVEIEPGQDPFAEDGTLLLPEPVLDPEAQALPDPETLPVDTRTESDPIKTTWYHGSPNNNIEEFSTYELARYGLFGKGTYFTDDANIASEYANTRPGNPTVYPVSLAPKNSLVMEDLANIPKWKNAISSTDYFNPEYIKEGMTNEQVYREIEEQLIQEQIPDYEAEDIILNTLEKLGVDSIKHKGGRKGGKAHNVTIMLNSQDITPKFSSQNILKVNDSEFTQTPIIFDGEQLLFTEAKDTSPKVIDLPVELVNPRTLKQSNFDFKKVKTEELQGEYDNRLAAPIQVFERLNGDLEVVSGRHRTRHALRNNVPEIAIQRYREADGWTEQQMKTIDAELNIKNGDGDVFDVANYIREANVSEADARARGLLQRDFGRKGFDLATKASNELFTQYKNGIIPETKAIAIARAAPGNENYQKLGIKFAKQYSSDVLGDFLPAVDRLIKKKMSQAKTAEEAKKLEQLDMFSNNKEVTSVYDAGIQIAKNAGAIRRQMRELIYATEGLVNNPEKAGKVVDGVRNISPEEFEQAKKTLAELQLEYEKYKSDNWNKFPEVFENLETSSTPDILTRLRSEAGFLDIRPMAEMLLNFGQKVNDQLRFFFRKSLNIDGAIATEIPWIEQYLSNGVLGSLRRNMMFSSTVADKDVQYRPIYEAAFNIELNKNKNNAEFARLVEPYLKLDKIIRSKINKVFYANRMADAKGAKVDESAEGLAAQGLNNTEIDAYLAVRNTLSNVVPEKIRAGWLKNPPIKYREAKQQIRKLYPEYKKLQGILANAKAQAALYGKKFTLANAPADFVAKYQQAQKNYQAAYSTWKGYENALNSFVEGMKSQKYFPISREGTYYVYSADYKDSETGAVGWFSRFKDSKEARASIENLVRQGYAPKHGHMQETWQNKDDSYDGMDIELQAKLAEFDPDALEDLQRRLNFKTADKGFIKHLQQAKFVSGFDPNSNQLQKYLSSLAHWDAMQTFSAEFDKGFNAIDNNKVLLKEQAMKLNQYMRKNVAEWNKLRKFYNVWYLSRPISAITNLSQQFVTTVPEISKYLGITRSYGFYAQTLKDTGHWMANEKSFTKTNPELAQALQEQVDTGLLSDKAGEALNEQAQGIDPNTDLSKYLLVMFSAAEKVNRYNAFIAGFKIAEIQEIRKYEDKVNFAKNFVRTTQFDYSKANKPPMARGMGALGFTFRLYQGNILRYLRNNLSKNGWKTAVQMLAHLTALAGVAGAPGSREIFKLLEGLGFDPKQIIRDQELPDWLEDSAIYGVPSVLGTSISSSVASGDLLPGIEENPLVAIGRFVVGVAADIPTRAANAYEVYNKTGDTGKAVEQVLPPLIKQGKIAYDWATTGKITDKMGDDISAPIYDKDGELIAGDLRPSSLDIVWKGLIGGTPTSAAKAYDRKFLTSKLQKEGSDNKSINQLIANAELKAEAGDPQDLIELESWLEGYNADAPDYKKISPNNKAIQDFKNKKFNPVGAIIDKSAAKVRAEQVRRIRSVQND